MAAVTPSTTRQTRLYEDTCNVWKPDTISLASDGEPADTTYTLTATAQVCYLFSTQNIVAPAPFGRYRQGNIMTLDVIHFPSGVDVADQYVIKLTTAGTDYANTFWLLESPARDRPIRSRRRAGVREYYLRQLRAAPAGVS